MSNSAVPPAMRVNSCVRCCSNVDSVWSSSMLLQRPVFNYTKQGRSSACCLLDTKQKRSRQQSTKTRVVQVQEVATDSAVSPAPAQEPATSGPSISGQPQNSLNGFSWTSYWYPVHVLESIDPSRPHALQLLGKQLVLWRDGQGSWQCMEDACPHRLAPLSEGRVQDGTLMCSYHGWRFDSSGTCVDIPQALDDKAKHTACNSSRSCVRSYPTREAHGLIWVWPSAGPAATAAAAEAPLPLSKGVLKASEKGQYLRWYRRELEYSWDILIENLTDPSHLPFSHHNLLPSMNRKHGQAMPFKAVPVPQGSTPEDAAARPDFCLPHQAPVAAFEFPSAQSPNGIVCFHPPVAVVYEYSLGFMGPFSMQNDLLAVPAAPGKALVFTLGTSNTPTVTNTDLLNTLLTKPTTLPTMLMRAHFQRRPTYSAHLLANKLFDQDNVFLAMQDRQLALRGKENWYKDYYMPTPCDGLVAAARKWASQALQLQVSDQPLTLHTGSNGTATAKPATTAAQLFSLAAETAAQQPAPSAQHINDRMKQHTQHCIICQQALQQLKAKLLAAQIAAAVFATGLVGLLSAAVLPGVLSWMGQLTTGSAAAAAAAVVPAGAPFVATAAAILAVSAALSAFVALSTASLIEQFVYVPFSHAHND